MNEHYLTVGKLKEWIKKFDLPDDANIYLQHLDEFYIRQDPTWIAKRKEGEMYNMLLHIKNTDAESTITYSMLENVKDKYVKCFSPIHYKGDNNLYLDVHW